LEKTRSRRGFERAPIGKNEPDEEDVYESSTPSQLPETNMADALQFTVLSQS